MISVLEVAIKATCSHNMIYKATKGEYVEAILRSQKTIFTLKDVALIWRESNADVIKKRLSKYVKEGNIIRIRRGIYAKDKNYNHYELATHILTPAYVSFETVLTQQGVNFQLYKSIMVASYVNRTLVIDKQKYQYTRMKDYVLTETKGIMDIDGVTTATVERALLDSIYINKKHYMDNSAIINWQKVFEILPIYNNKRMEKVVDVYYKEFVNKINNK